MIRFAAGLAIIVFTAILGIYKYLDIRGDYDSRQSALYDALDKRDQGKNLQQRIREIRRISALNNDAKKLDVERLLNIGAPGLEWRVVGQPLTRGSNKALYRYTYRIAGPSTFTDSQNLMERMNQLPGFVIYRFCFACTEPPRGTSPNLSMVQIEGYLYAYDPDTLY